MMAGDRCLKGEIEYSRARGNEGGGGPRGAPLGPEGWHRLVLMCGGDAWRLHQPAFIAHSHNHNVVPPIPSATVNPALSSPDGRITF